MPNLNIAATDRTPEVNLDADNGKLSIKGESYPEDVTAFYGPILEQIDGALGALDGGELEIEFELIYFNSSSAKIFMGLFDSFEEAAEDGNKITINWRFDEEDDAMEELGEEFAEDLENAKLNMIKITE